ncbi:unnamed protein product, partial [Sphagnum compactum]
MLTNISGKPPEDKCQAGNKLESKLRDILENLLPRPCNGVSPVRPGARAKPGVADQSQGPLLHKARAGVSQRAAEKLKGELIGDKPMKGRAGLIDELDELIQGEHAVMRRGLIRGSEAQPTRRGARELIGSEYDPSCLALQVGSTDHGESVPANRMGNAEPMMRGPAGFTNPERGGRTWPGTEFPNLG